MTSESYWLYVKSCGVIASNVFALWWTRGEIESGLKFGTLITTFIAGIMTVIKLYLDISKSRSSRSSRSSDDDPTH